MATKHVITTGLPSFGYGTKYISTFGLGDLADTPPLTESTGLSGRHRKPLGARFGRR